MGSHDLPSGYQSGGDVRGYRAGLYGSWRQDAKTCSGLYLDGWALYNRFNNTVARRRWARAPPTPSWK
ncbi:MAG: autotransporter outer membrane beta-barrel domain-containing protein [Achromobacter sp.]|nr:autotransporter outer membrane beta-barrel domain-containing protein [Achromobacter pulmonis]MPT29456.1 autotransporter outer membrane beta-barrel domain-containing protein [Achromobacter sp.]